MTPGHYQHALDLEIKEINECHTDKNIEQNNDEWPSFFGPPYPVQQISQEYSFLYFNWSISRRHGMTFERCPTAIGTSKA